MLIISPIGPIGRIGRIPTTRTRLPFRLVPLALEHPPYRAIHNATAGRQKKRSATKLSVIGSTREKRATKIDPPPIKRLHGRSTLAAPPNPSRGVIKVASSARAPIRMALRFAPSNTGNVLVRLRTSPSISRRSKLMLLTLKMMKHHKKTSISLGPKLRLSSSTGHKTRTAAIISGAIKVFKTGRSFNRLRTKGIGRE